MDTAPSVYTKVAYYVDWVDDIISRTSKEEKMQAELDINNIDMFTDTLAPRAKTPTDVEEEDSAQKISQRYALKIFDCSVN